MASQRMEPGHQQPCYWPSSSGIFQFHTRRVQKVSTHFFSFYTDAILSYVHGELFLLYILYFYSMYRSVLTSIRMMDIYIRIYTYIYIYIRSKPNKATSFISMTMHDENVTYQNSHQRQQHRLSWTPLSYQWNNYSMVHSLVNYWSLLPCHHTNRTHCGQDGRQQGINSTKTQSLNL